MNQIQNSNQAAAQALQQAILAAAQKTFAVGGLLVINKTGEIVCRMHNNVLKPLNSSDRIFTFDPTAHGERQVVYWYYENRNRLGLPTPNEMTVITTLDPCAMCAGALLTAGFNVGVMAIDVVAGINFNKKFDFAALPPALRKRAQSSFGYYACGKAGDPPVYVRKYIGSAQVAFCNSVVEITNMLGCSNIFEATVVSVRDNSSNSGATPDKLSNPAKLPKDSPLIKKFKDKYAYAFDSAVTPRCPDGRLKKELERIVKLPGTEEKAKNAVALLDPFGNIALCLADTFEKGPVFSAFMNVTQVYAALRFDLMNDPATRALAEQYLTHPKYGTFVFLNAPDPDDPATVMDLGAYGSTLEGEVPQVFPANLQYYNPPKIGDEAGFQRTIMDLPPFYTQIAKISAMRVAEGKK